MMIKKNPPPALHLVVNSRSKCSAKITVLSNLLTGWFACLKLLNSLNGANFSLSHICHDLESITDISHATTLDFSQLMLLRDFGVSEQQLMRECDGYHCLGNRYIDWSKAEQQFNFVNGDYGVDFHRVEFSQYISWQLQQTPQLAVEDFSIAALMAKNNKFTHPSADKKSILSTYSYSLNVDSTKFISLLRQLACAKKSIIKEIKSEVTIIHNDLAQVTLIKVNAADKVRVTELTSDFYFDATCDIKSLEVENNSTRLSGAQQSFIAELTAIKTSAVVTKLQAHQFGWSKITYLKSKSIIECCYRVNHSNQEQGQNQNQQPNTADEKSLNQVLSVLAQAGFEVNKNTILHKTPSAQKSHNIWQQNTLLLGGSYGQLAPLGVEPLTELNYTLALWLSLFPSKQVNQSLIEFFNHRQNQRHAHVADYSTCHYHLAQWRESEFWQQVNTENVAESLTGLLRFFKLTGHLPALEEPAISHKQWHILLLGLGVIPQVQDPMIHNEPNITEKLISLRAYIQKFAERIPPYQEYLKHHGL
ncbi:MAG: tryptophan 7-halogenase [Thalassotalea sp.]